MGGRFVIDDDPSLVAQAHRELRMALQRMRSGIKPLDCRSGHVPLRDEDHFVLVVGDAIHLARDRVGAPLEYPAQHGKGRRLGVVGGGGHASGMRQQ